MKSPLSVLQLSQQSPEDQPGKCSIGSAGGSTSSGGQSCSEDGPRWGTPRPSSVSSSSCTTETLAERELGPVPSGSGSKQPLPGFQQAFGSTEIGKFSRSELFASLVEAANVSSGESRSASPGSPYYQPAPPRWHSPYAGAIGSEI